MTNVKITVIIPIYNVGIYLKECIESVIEQTFKAVEIICIDDASTDNAQNILEYYKNIDGRLSILKNNVNRGLSYTRNRGLGIAKGDYIYFLDADDKIKSNMLENLYNIAESETLDGIFFDGEVLFENELLKAKNSSYLIARKKQYNHVMCGKDFFCTSILNNEFITSVPRQFWNRKYLLDNNLKFKEGILHEDILFSFMALIKAKRVRCIEDRFFIRRFRENSIMTMDFTFRNYEGILSCYSKICEYWHSILEDNNLDKAIFEYLLNLEKNIMINYRKLKENNISKFCSQDTIREKYQIQLFNKLISGLIICEQIDLKHIEIIKGYENIVIYGAGVVAEDIVKLLNKYEVVISGFIVSDIKQNPKAIMGHKVYQADKFICEKSKTLVILGTSSKYSQDIKNKLKELKFENIINVIK